MDKIAQYRQIIMEELEKYAHLTDGNPPSDFRDELVFDTTHDHYQVLTIGWSGKKRAFSPTFHLSIREGKIWIEANASDYDIVREIEARGIPKSDIVLAFHSPSIRQHTGYAVA